MSVEFCVRAIAAHEFGHALGFAHEQNRSDAPAWCRDQAQGHDGDIFMTPYDSQSIMNYCNPAWNNNGGLSANDIAGLQFWYGPGASSGMPWLPDCRNDPLLFQDAFFAGRRLLLRGSMEGLGVEDFNDRSSSLCVPAGYRLLVFEDAHHRGRFTAFDGPIMIPRISAISAGGRSGWNDVISAVRLIDLTSGTEVFDAPPQCRSKATLFQHDFYRGTKVAVDVDIPRLSAKSFNDAASAVCVPPGKTLTLFEHADFGGATVEFAGPAFQQRLSGVSFNDKASAVRLK